MPSPHRRGPFPRLFRMATVAFAFAAAGCAQTGPVLPRSTSVGTLRTSLSHMEYENQQLRREVAGLKAEVRDAENRLVQEEGVNGELSAKLDDAVAMLRRRGGPDQGEGLAEFDRPRTTLPAGRPVRKGRKPPFAQIRNQVESLPSDPSDENDTSPSSGWGTPAPGPSDDPGPQSRLDGPALWLPIAQGTTAADARHR